jgi:large subunit ribosomal protein L3
MATGILGRKVGMTQVFDESGRIVPVTVLEAGPCHVLQVRTIERDGYEAVQLGFSDKRRPGSGKGGKAPRHAASRSERGHVAKLDSKRSRARSAAGVELLAKAGCEPKKFIREFRGAPGDLVVGSVLDATLFADVKAVDVISTSKGRGFSGVMKRHNFAGQRATHGVKKCHRHLGGTGCSAYPSRVFKGKKMAGRYGGARITMRNLKVVRVDGENHLLLVRGAVPGPQGVFVVIRQTNKV